MEWPQAVGAVVGIAGALVGIAGAMVVSFWRGATFVQTITRAITESEERLRSENKLLGEKIEGLKVDVAVLKDARQQAAKSGQLEFNAPQLAKAVAKELAEHAPR